MTKTDTRFTDTNLKAAVVEELKWVPSINSANVGVAVSDGAVTLSGEVDTYPEKRMAVKAAQRVHGVLAVADEITVRRDMGWGELNDTDIARYAGEALSRAVDVPDTIKAAVHDNVIVLSGEAWQFERVAAVRAVKYLSGVRDVRNDVMIRKGKATVAAEVKDAIGRALVRNAQIDGSHINVTCDGSGAVTLAGSVRSWDERGQAESASWAAPGVTAVRDNLHISYSAT